MVPTSTYSLMFFQNIARAKLREVLLNVTEVLRRFSVLLTRSSTRSPRAVTFSRKENVRNQQNWIDVRFGKD